MEMVDKLLEKHGEEKITKWFHQVCKLEAISWAFLFSAMIWIRYDPDGLWSIIYIATIGNIHGLFFTLYLLLILPARKIYKWDDEDFVFALISAFFPFATIWIEKKYARFDRED